MGLKREKYCQKRIDKLGKSLEIKAERGNAQDYSILVDDIEVVERTDAPELFDSYSDFVDGDTRTVTIKLFSGSSNNNDRIIFYFSEMGEESGGLHGIDNLDSKIQSSVDQAKKEWKHEQLVKDFGKVQTELEEANKYIDDLEEAVNKLQDRKWYSGNLDMAELFSRIAEGMVKRNPHWLKAIPGGSELAGVVAGKATETSTSVPDHSESSGSFKRKEDKSEFSEEDKKLLIPLKGIQQKFQGSELDHIILILDTLTVYPELLPDIIELLTQKLNNND